jgi:hypothetical protein
MLACYLQGKVDLDSAYHFDVDPDVDPDLPYQFDADANLNPDSTFQFDADHALPDPDPQHF